LLFRYRLGPETFGYTLVCFRVLCSFLTRVCTGAYRGHRLLHLATESGYRV